MQEPQDFSCLLGKNMTKIPMISLGRGLFYNSKKSWREPLLTDWRLWR
jgi:hypothetical protein